MKLQSIEARNTGDTILLRRILLPMDFSPASKKALSYANSLAHRFGSELILLHVLEAPPAFPSLAPARPTADWDDDWLRAEKDLHALSALPGASGGGAVRTALRAGDPAGEIADAAREFDADLIVIAAHGSSSWKHFCIGSTTEKVVRYAPCPVLAVREKEHDFC